MPIPFLLAGLGLVAGVVGAGGHMSAKEKNEQAQEIVQDARNIYDNAKRALDIAHSNTEKSLLKLGYSKKNVLESSMKQFLTTYNKIKHIQIRESVGINEISKFIINEQGAIQLREMTDIYSSSFQSSVAGAAAGAAVALAASGALPLVTGQLALAGSALAAGQIGLATGFASSALSLGAAMTPLTAVAAPVILFTGISATMKADENLEKANTMYAEAELAAEQMKTSEILCCAISERSEMFDTLLGNLNQMFSECSELLTTLVRKKEGRIFKKKLTSSDFTENDLKLIAVTRALAGAVKSVIDTPILSKDCNISSEAVDIYDQMVDKIPDFSQEVENVKEIDYNVQPIIAKSTIEQPAKNDNNNILKNIPRNIFAIIIGIIFSSIWSIFISSILIDESSYWFTSICALIWCLLFQFITIHVGKFKGTLVRNIFAIILSLIVSATLTDSISSMLSTTSTTLPDSMYASIYFLLFPLIAMLLGKFKGKILKKIFILIFLLALGLLFSQIFT